MQYERGDYVEVEFDGKSGLPGEWMWVRVDRCDQTRRLLFGRLDNEPLLTVEVELGQELAISRNDQVYPADQSLLIDFVMMKQCPPRCFASTHSL